MSIDVEKLHNGFLKKHLAYVEHTEAPALFHIWAALGCVSACMGRHLYTETGIGRNYGNMYVLLVGPPATKKSSAIRFATTIMRGATSVRFAPDDTGGQRQGLIQAMLDEDEENPDEADRLEVAMAADMASLADIEMSLGRRENKHHMFANASEFGSFIGSNASDLARFLIKVYDGENYVYKLRAVQNTLVDPLLAILGGTTPADMATLLPAEAIGQGFTSRIILVYQPTKGKIVPPSAMRLDETLAIELSEVYRIVWTGMVGRMDFDDDAIAFLDRVYRSDHKIEDARFIYYLERRDSHLRKLSMVLAASRLSMRISIEDVYDAEYLLRTVERYMPEALGEYGLSPLAVARQKMLEYLRHAGEPVSERLLWAIMSKDMKLIDFHNTISSLAVADKITPIDATLNGKATRMYIYNDMKDDMAKLDDKLLDELLAGDIITTSTRH